jgi:hypothetical protein
LRGKKRPLKRVSCSRDTKKQDNNGALYPFKIIKLALNPKLLWILLYLRKSKYYTSYKWRTVENPLVLTNQDLKAFIEEYIAEYRRLVEDSYGDKKDLFSLYKYYPIQVIAYLTPTKTLWEYIPNAPKFEIQIKEAKDLPEVDTKNKHYLYGFRNDYLLKILKEAKRVARNDVLNIISDYENYEENLKEQSEYYDRQYAEYAADHVREIIDSYTSYIDIAYKVKTETILKYENRVFDVILVIQNIREHLFESFLTSGCAASLEVLDEVVQDMESSLFLAIHGKYIPATALLRRILENTLTALYFDDKIRKCTVGSRTHEALCKKRDTWVEKSSKRGLNFSGDYGVLGELIDPDVDYLALTALSKTNPSAPRSFRGYVKQKYGDLSKFVHYGGPGLVDRFSIIFAELNEQKFEEWVSRFKQVLEIYAIMIAIKFPVAIKSFEKDMSEIEPLEQIHLLTAEQVEILIQQS